MKTFLLSIFSIILLVAHVSCSDNKAQEVEKIKVFPSPKIKFNPRSYICYKTNETLTVDGVLDEASWENTKWSEKFIDIEGKQEPIHQTRIKMLWSEKYLYIAAELIEPHINAQLRQRDTVIFYDNDFEVFIDPDGDTHNYFEFEMNAFNTVWDLLITQPYREKDVLVIDAWNILGLKSAVKTYGTINNTNDIDEKWTVELAFPMSILTEGGRKTPKDNDLWRINFSRVQWQYDIVNGKYKKKVDEKGEKLPEYNWVWSPQGLINMHYPEMWGFLQFSELEPGNTNAEFIMPQSELMKWELRKIYYAQKNYFNKYNKYSSSAEELKNYGYKGDKSQNISIMVTKSEYEAILAENGNSWSINSAGKTFRTLQ